MCVRVCVCVSPPASFSKWIAGLFNSLQPPHHQYFVGEVQANSLYLATSEGGEKMQPRLGHIGIRNTFLDRVIHLWVPSLRWTRGPPQGTRVGITTSVTPSIIHVSSCISQAGLFMSAKAHCNLLHWLECLPHLSQYLTPSKRISVVSGLGEFSRDMVSHHRI